MRRCAEAMAFEVSGKEMLDAIGPVEGVCKGSFPGFGQHSITLRTLDAIPLFWLQVLERFFQCSRTCLLFLDVGCRFRGLSSSPVLEWSDGLDVIWLGWRWQLAVALAVVCKLSKYVLCSRYMTGVPWCGKEPNGRNQQIRTEGIVE